MTPIPTSLASLALQPPSLLNRFRWARFFGATWKAVVCALRGWHRWNVICCFADNTCRPSAPTSCLTCRCRYTEEWEALVDAKRADEAKEKP